MDQWARNFFSLPLGVNSEDRVVAYTEWGEPIYQAASGAQYWFGSDPWAEPEKPRRTTRDVYRTDQEGRVYRDYEDVDRKPGEAVIRALAGVPKGLWDIISAPTSGNATYGDVWNAAGMVQLGAAPLSAPSGAIRSGAMRTTDDSGRAAADEIMGLLQSGRGAEVTDSLMASADQAYLSSIYDLPLDHANRMQRAQEIGFRANMPLYHGTATDFPAFDMGQAGKVTNNPASRKAVWLTDDPTVADEFATLAAGSEQTGQQVLPVLHKADRPVSGQLPHDATNESVALTLDGAFGDGYDAVRLTDYTTPLEQEGKNIFAIKDPAQIRSVFARFDPRLSHLRNLTAGVGGAAVAGNAMGGQEPADIAALREWLNSKK